MNKVKYVGKLFLISLPFLIGNYLVSARMTGWSYRLFLFALSEVYAICFYGWVLSVWKRAHRISWKEGLCVMGWQAVFYLLVFVGLKHLRSLLEGTVFQILCCLIFLFWLPLTLHVYRCLVQKTWRVKVRILPCLSTMAWLVLLVGLDSLLHSVYVFGSFYSLCATMANGLNLWYGCMTSVGLGLIFHLPMNQVLLWSSLFLVAGLIDAFALTFVLSLYEKGEDHGTS